MPKARSRKKLTLMVSSTVYGVEELLDQVYALLSGFGYEVWMSHKGTMPVDPTATALDNCLNAVGRCDLFFSIITPQYGSGVLDGELGITHQELLRAIDLKKPRWILAHDHVVFARSLFRKLGARDATARAELLKKLGYADKKSLGDLRKREAHVIDDFRVIDMYEAAILHDIREYQDRTGNWVQKYNSEEEVRLFATAQFSRHRDVERFVREQFGTPTELKARIAAEVGTGVRPKRGDPTAGKAGGARPKATAGPPS
jgi:hypothetical protein